MKLVVLFFLSVLAVIANTAPELESGQKPSDQPVVLLPEVRVRADRLTDMLLLQPYYGKDVNGEKIVVHLMVKSVIPGSPAFKAGIREGMAVWAVEKVYVKGKPVKSLVDLVKIEQPESRELKVFLYTPSLDRFGMPTRHMAITPAMFVVHLPEKREKPVAPMVIASVGP